MTTINKEEETKHTINAMRAALINIAKTEEGVLNKLLAAKEQLDTMLDNIYGQLKENKKVMAKDIMLNENHLTEADVSLATGLDSLITILNNKNNEIQNLKKRLAALGVALPSSALSSVEMLSQHLNRLDKHNRQLQAIHREMLKTPMITGRVEKGVSVKSLKQLLDNMHKQINDLNQENFALKQKIKPHHEKQDTLDNGKQNPHQLRRPK